MSERDIFLAALDLSPDDRAAFLAERCGADADLRKRVDALFHAHSAAGDFLADPFDPGGTTATFDARTRTRSPTTAGAVGEVGELIAGRYKLLERIGEGGMGSVWMADQTEPVKRKVAVKLIKPGLDSKTVLARFEAERQALALMDHPNIAKVLDGGVHDGRPYFVMELVKGVPITHFCDARKLTPQQRLELFVPVCQAIQHAHQKGVIHRDIKPANVLVALYDDRPVPKVIDFGVAKATGPTLTEHTLNTGFGGVVGTPQYMSPEQATFNNLDIDTRSDVYSLGVLLYELLAGSPPFKQKELEKRGLLEMLRVVREEEPPKPSTKLSTADALPSLSADRGMEPKKLTGLLRNELDWIVMKALEKDRTRRYETANGFAADVNRYLSGEPVQAHPPSTGYRLRKFVRKNRGPVVAGSLVLLALSLGMTGTTFGLLRAEQKRVEADQAKQRESERADGEREAKEEAVAERKRAVEFRDQALDALRATTGEDVEKLIGEKKDLTANEKAYLEAIAQRWQAFAQQEGTDEQSRAIRGEGHIRVAKLWGRLGRREEARPEYEQAVAVFEKLAADFPAVPDYRHDLARSHNNLGIQLADLGKRTEAQEQYKQALAIKEKLAADFPAVPDYRRELAGGHNSLGIVLVGLGKWAEAQEQYKQALVIQEKLATDFPTVPDYRHDLAQSHINLGLVLARLRQRAEAQEQYHKARALLEKLAADFPAVPVYRRNLARSHNSLGIVLVGLGKRAEAEGQYKQALVIQQKLAADFPAMPDYRSDLAQSHNNLGLVLAGLGKRAEAEEQYKQAQSIFEKLAADFPAVPVYRSDLAASHSNLGALLADLGKPAEAEEQYKQAVAIQEKLAADFPAVPDYRHDLARSHNNLGALLADLGQWAEAQEQYKQAVAIQEKLVADFPAVPVYRSDLAGSHNNLGLLLAGLGKRAEAEGQYKQALVIQQKLAADFPAVPVYRSDLAQSHNNLGLLLAALGRRAEAQEQHHKALVIEEKLAADFPTVPDYRIDLGGSYCNFGNLIRDWGRAGESLDWFDKAIATLAPVHRAEPRDVTAKQFLRNSHQNRAIAYDQLQKYVDAVKDWDRAIELSPPAAQARLRARRATSRLRAGQVAEAVAEVAELTKSPNATAGQWYDFACVYAVASGKIADKKQEYSDTGMELLQKAVKAGWKDAAHIKKDTDLDPLRERDDFKKLVADLEAKFPPKKEVLPPPRADK